MRVLGGIILLSVGCMIGLVASALANGVQYPLGTATERISPADHIKESDIEVLSDRVIIKLDNPRWASLADTNSMDPVLDTQSNAIQITPTDPDMIQVGDIISFRRADKVIIHRVIEKGIDGEGWYFITQGDNNPQPDAGKIRFTDITRLTVAVIY